ncbi:MAG: hypothetical protein JSS45_04690 [Proteobacteria bacterium]|nr:hypothetical protein [Pseudomonadota bacterium]
MRDTASNSRSPSTARLFMLGKAQAVRIPARYRLQADAVEITEQDGALILRPKPRTMGEVIARVHAKYGKLDLPPVPRSKAARPIKPLEL